jgi:hypothetical protein
MIGKFGKFYFNNGYSESGIILKFDNTQLCIQALDASYTFNIINPIPQLFAFKVFEKLPEQKETKAYPPPLPSTLPNVEGREKLILEKSEEASELEGRIDSIKDLRLKAKSLLQLKKLKSEIELEEVRNQFSLPQQPLQVTYGIPSKLKPVYKHSKK